MLKCPLNTLHMSFVDAFISTFAHHLTGFLSAKFGTFFTKCTIFQKFAHIRATSLHEYDDFTEHLNSRDPHIQLTIELERVTENYPSWTPVDTSRKTEQRRSPFTGNIDNSGTRDTPLTSLPPWSLQGKMTLSRDELERPSKFTVRP